MRGSSRPAKGPNPKSGRKNSSKRIPGPVEKGFQDGAETMAKASDAFAEGSEKLVLYLRDSSGRMVGKARLRAEKRAKDVDRSMRSVMVLLDSSGQAVGEVAREVLKTSEGVADRSAKGAVLVVDGSGKAVGEISEEALRTSGLVVKKTQDGVMLARTGAERISGAQKARTKKEYYQRLGYFFGPLAALLLVYASYFLFFDLDDALKLLIWGILYFFAIPGFDQNTLILSAKTFGMNPYAMALNLGIQDTIIGVFLCLNFDYAKKIPLLGKLITEVEEGGKEMLTKYGWLNKISVVFLFVFILLPFNGCGPVAGSIVGRIIGIRVRYIIFSIVVGSFIAVFVLAYLADRIAEAFPPWVQIGIPVAIALLLVGFFVYSYLKKRKMRLAEDRGKKKRKTRSL